MMKENKYSYKVIDIVKETEDVSTLFLSCPEFNIADYIAGQYITIYFPESGMSEGKAYSISSAPSEKIFTITIKAIGDFSNKLTSLKIGDFVVASLPYGYFYIESETVPVVMIAGGIGITPLRSMIFESASVKKSRKVTLLYSAETQSDILFKKQFDELQKKNNNFDVKYFVTKEDKKSADVRNSRIKIEDILRCVEDKNNTEFFICGSISFTRDMWKGLHASCISEKKIFTEAFF